METPTTQPTVKVFGAFVKAQAEFKVPVKNCKANYGKYADLAAIFEAIRPALAKNDLAITQDVTCAENGLFVETKLIHASGETLTSGKLFMPVTPLRGMSEAQSFGAIETYARRYSATAFLGIVADDDTDAQDDPQGPAPKAPPLIKEVTIKALTEASKKGSKAFRSVFKALPTDQRSAANADKKFIQSLKANCEKVDAKAEA